MEVLPLDLGPANNRTLPPSIMNHKSPAANGDIVLFSSDDTGGDEIRTVQGVSYDYTVDGGGGYFTLLDTDFVKDTRSEWGFQRYQDGSNVIAKIFLDGVKKLEKTVVQTLSHSDTAFEIGWRSTTNVHFSGNEGDVSVFDNDIYRLTDADFERLAA